LERLPLYCKQNVSLCIQALYAAKHAGRNRVLMYEQHDTVPDPQGDADPAMPAA
jgi:hypothetical protein